MQGRKARDSDVVAISRVVAVNGSVEDGLSLLDTKAEVESTCSFLHEAPTMQEPPEKNLQGAIS
jgi:hypothetical protein